MKNKITVVISLALMLIVIGIISVLSVRTAEKNNSKLTLALGGKAELRNTIELPLAQVAELEVIYTSRNLKLYPTDGDTIVIKEYLITEDEEGKAEVSYEILEGDATGRSKVTVTGNQDKVFTIFGVFAGEERIEIYLPEKGLDALALEVKSGNITALEEFALEVDNLDITAKSGNIKWQDTKADSISVQAKSGNITLKGITGKLEIETGSGNIKLEDVVGNAAIAAGSGTIKVLDIEGKAAVATGSGSITVEDLVGAGSFAAGSGTIKIDMEQVTGDIAASTGSGSIRLTLPQGLSFEFEGKTGSGNLNTTFDEKLSYNQKGNEASGMIGETPICKVKVEAQSGNIDIIAE